MERADTMHAATNNAGLRVGVRVLASGSRGNCSVLRIQCAGETLTALIDAGLSPRRTRAAMAACGLSLDEVDVALLTHLDTDHFYSGWVSKLPLDAPFVMHRRHRGRAERQGALRRRTTLVDGPFDLCESLPPARTGARALPPCIIRVTPTLMSHDDLGVAAFRFDIESGAERASVGWATDLGRVTDRLIGAMEGVGLLAIESNYCPHLQRASSRPAYLKQRIMGGSGHLSNGESAEAVGLIRPRDAVALLHLSQECNTPERALEAHAAHRMAVSVTSQDEPSGWIMATTRAAVTIPAREGQGALFG